MASSFEKSVKGATKSKAAPPKSKYIEHILIATYSGEQGVAEVFRSLQHRIRDTTWTVVLKSLITTHLMIREGSPDVTLAYLARNYNLLNTNTFSDAQTQGRNIRHYTNYLGERAKAFRETKCDFVRGAASRLEKLTVDKGLLRETETVQHQITALLKCDVLDNEPENEITITVFRMLVLDLLALFHAMNAGLINILGHFFEMSKIDAERALEIYKRFTQQTETVVQYLSTARQYEYQTRVEVPKLKHAPTNLGKQLEDYLLDSDFEANRRQYLAEQESKSNRTIATGAKRSLSTKTSPQPRTVANNKFPEPKNEKSSHQVKGPDPDLIDFFESIEQNQQPLGTQPGLQQSAFDFANISQFQTQEQGSLQNYFIPQQTGLPEHTQFQQVYGFELIGQQVSTSNPQQYNTPEFNGFTTPSFKANELPALLQESAPKFQPLSPQQQVFPMLNNIPQSTNPFRQSIRTASLTGVVESSRPAAPPTTLSLNRQSTNPFAKLSIQPSQDLLSLPDPGLQQRHTPQVTNPIRPTITGINPFAKNSNNNNNNKNNSLGFGQKPQQSFVIPQSTGNTNPFRQYQSNSSNASAVGWQQSQTPIGGGLDNLETVPVFPRPIQQLAWK